MISFDAIQNIYLVQGATDLRKGIDGYASIVQDRCKLDPYENSLFLFMNRQNNKLKCLYWDGNGFWLLYKRLDEGTFKWLKSSVDNPSVEITHQQLRWLLDGLNPVQKRAFEMKKYAFV